jgi:hypothetical protein
MNGFNATSTTLYAVSPEDTLDTENQFILKGTKGRMKSVLEEFACGNISPEPRFIKHNSDYEKAVIALSDAENKLRAALNGTEQGLLNTMLEAQGAVSLLANTDKFIYGYRLGVLMTMEVFNGKEDLTVGGKDC